MPSFLMKQNKNGDYYVIFGNTNHGIYTDDDLEYLKNDFEKQQKVRIEFYSNYSIQVYLDDEDMGIYTFYPEDDIYIHSNYKDLCSLMYLL